MNRQSPQLDDLIKEVEHELAQLFNHQKVLFNELEQSRIKTEQKLNQLEKLIKIQKGESYE